MRTTMIAIKDISIAKDRCKPKADNIKMMVKSFREIGQQTPISIRKSRDSAADKVRWNLVTGYTRLLAAKELGYKDIAALVFEGDLPDAGLWEIAENLHRRTLTAQERADALKRYSVFLVAREHHRKSVAEEQAARQAKREVSGQVGPKLKKNGRPPDPLSKRELAKSAGMSESDVRRLQRIAELTEDDRAACDAAGLNDQESRFAVATTPPDKRAAKIVEIVETRSKTNLSAKSNPITLVWRTASKSARLGFIAECGAELDALAKDNAERIAELRSNADA